MAATRIVPAFGVMALRRHKPSRGLRLSAQFSSSANASSVGTDMYGEMLNGTLRNATSFTPATPPALIAEVKARLVAAWPLAQMTFDAINGHLKATHAPHRLSHLNFNHALVAGGNRDRDLSLEFSPMPGSGARTFLLMGEWGVPLHLRSRGAAGLSHDEFGAILNGATVKGLDLAGLGAYYELTRPDGVQTAWQVAIAELPAIAQILSVLGLP